MPYTAMTTLNAIRAKSPCASGWTKLLAHLGKTAADDEPLHLLTVLNSNGMDDALWVLQYTGCDERLSRHFGAWCAEQVLPIFEAERPDDQRPRLAIASSRDDDETAEARAAARIAARIAARDAALVSDMFVARDAARAAARDVAREAARDAARAAAWDAARAAARDAAWDTAWEAARDAAWAAARDAAREAARDAAWAAQAAQLRKMLEEK